VLETARDPLPYARCRHVSALVVIAVCRLRIVRLVCASDSGADELRCEGDLGKVLKSKDENDIDSYVASAWSLLRVRREGRFLSGDPRRWCVAGPCFRHRRRMELQVKALARYAAMKCSPATFTQA
jgi:hypothetical protein